VRRITELSLISTAIILLVLVLLIGAAAEIEAQDISPQISNLTEKVSVLLQDTQDAISKWNSRYYVGSIEELEPAFNPGLAGIGTYSTVISGAALQTKELPY
jgi:predicted PurR-regulated permease PerM